MKTFFSSVILSVLFILSMNAQADTEHQAVVFRGDICVAWMDIDPLLAGPETLVGNKLHAVGVQPAPDGTFAGGKHTCRGTHGVPLEHAVVIRTPCSVLGPSGPTPITEKAIFIATPSGEWNAQCIFH